MTVYDGPDCGIDGCEREVGHIGDHRRVGQSFGLTINPDLSARIVPYSTVDALLIARRWVDAIGCVDMLTKRRIRKRDAIETIDALLRSAPSPEIACLCGDVFRTTETMAEHLWMAHGHEVPPRPESVRAKAEQLGIPLRDYGLPTDIVRPAPFEDDCRPVPDRLIEAAIRIRDKRTLADDGASDGYWISRREMRYLEEALAELDPENIYGDPG